jgi:simple sugar transport system ATP-binding protein
MHIELRNICKYFGTVKANDGINLVFESGRIYGLLGENGAGKSTLMKILSGYQPPDSGEIVIDGQPQHFASPAEALGRGIGMLYQDPLDIPAFNVKDNYLLGRDRRVILDYKMAREELEEITARFSFELDQQASIENLSLGERQQLELTRLLVGGAQVLILDEPTTGSVRIRKTNSSTRSEIGLEEGKTIILVSHKLDEVQELCGEGLILRKGKLVGRSEIPCPNEELVEKMFGQVPLRGERPVYEVGAPVLEIRDLRIPTYRLIVEDINLSVQAGEIFGLAGLEGSGQQLVLKACAGLVKTDRGRISMAGQDITHWSYQRLRTAGIGYIAAGRLEEGLVAGLSLTEHLVLSQPSHQFFVDWTGARKQIEAPEQYQIIGRLDPNADELSEPAIVIWIIMESCRSCEHPTRGQTFAHQIDLGAASRRQSGTAILFMSSDLDEIIDRSDRIAVFSGGKMSRILDAKKTTVDEVGHLIGGQA